MCAFILCILDVIEQQDYWVEVNNQLIYNTTGIILQIHECTTDFI